MLADFLPKSIYDALTIKINESEINEIHLRINKPISVMCNTKVYFLSENGLCSNSNLAISATSELLQKIVFKASDYSIYSVNEQIKHGYMMVDGGIRIGICGEVVKDTEVKTIKNFTSLCIRVPHTIKNVSLPIFSQILNAGDVNNTLIVAPPTCGKTTLIRDIIYQFSSHNYAFNVFIADERGEITGGKNDIFKLGHFCDSLSFLNKKDAFLMGIKNMSPDIIVTDELGAKEDYEALEYALNCGVKVIATMHARNIDELKQKTEFKSLIEKKYFKRFVVLSKERGIGTIEGVYNENLSRIYGATI